MKKLFLALLFISPLAFGGGVTTGGTSGGTASDATLTTTDITTNDVSTSKHGFAPKGTIGTTQFWRQDWTLGTPAGGTATPGGSTGQLEYNDAGAFGGITGATTNGTILTLVTPVLGAATATSINGLALSGSAANFATLVGTSAGGLLLSTDTKNTAFGFEAMKLATGGGSDMANAAFGYRALTSLTTGINNTAIGDGTLFNITTASNNTAVGEHVLLTATGASNTGIGSQALQSLTTGTFNVAVGASVFNGVVTGDRNIGIGKLVAAGLTSGSDNIAMGDRALANVAAATNNIAIGSTALFTTTASSNVAIGEAAGQSTTGSGSVFIGFEAGKTETGANKLYIDNSSTTTPLIGGDFSANTVTIGGVLTATGGYLSSDGSAGETVTTGGLTIKNGIVTAGTITSGAGDALTTNPLSQFATTTSAQLFGVLSDETGSASGALAVFSKSPSIDSPTISTGMTLSSAPLTISGNISSAAWTTSGLRIKGVPGTLTDTSSSGTVAAAYTDILGGNTIAASSATTFTNYFSQYNKEPVAGTNVTLTNKWALGGDSMSIGTSNPVTITTAGVLTATSPVFVTPVLGTPASGNGSNLTALNATQLTSGTVSLSRLTGITTSQTTGIAASGVNSDITSITGLTGTVGSATGYKIRDSSAAFDLTLAATSSTTLTAGRTLTLDMGNVAHTIAFGTTAGAITFPNTAAMTVARIDAAQSFTGTQTFSGTVALGASANLTLAGNSKGINLATGNGNSAIQIGGSGSNYFAIGPVSNTTSALGYNSGGVGASFTSVLTWSDAPSVTIGGGLIATPQALSGSGAIDLVTTTTAFTSTAAANALTLANGTNGQIKTIVHVSKGTAGTGILTPTTANGYTTITLTNAGDSVTLQYFTTGGWAVIASRGATIA